MLLSKVRISLSLDSITIDKAGNYEFQFIAKQEGIYRLATDKEFEIIFINDDDNIKISADASNYSTYSVKGSNSTSNLFDFLKQYRQKERLQVFLREVALLN